MRRLTPFLLSLLALAAGCDTPPNEPQPEDAPVLLQALDLDALALPAPPEGSLPVRAGIFLGTFSTSSPDRDAAAAAAGRVRTLVEQTNGILAQCGLHLELEAAQVVGLPARLLDVHGNRKGSWGGHPPEDVGDPELFTYNENERLTEETRELFAYGKRHTSANAISAFFVRSIEYYIGEERTGAGGLSFPPNGYHHPDDYPLRNSVLVVGRYERAAFSDAYMRVLAHELGHMLLNSGSHVGGTGNLMTTGTKLSPEQCERMRANRVRLYGEDAVPDPGPPA